MQNNSSSDLSDEAFKSGSFVYVRGKTRSLTNLFSRKDSSSTVSSLSSRASDRPTISSVPSYRSYRSSKSSVSSFYGDEAERTTINAITCDGGGVRGASSAKVIAMIMEDLSDATGKKENPCDHFNMMAGTSTGGLIALMLGRLKVPVDTLVSAYPKLSKKLFKSRVKHFRAAFRGSKYSSKLAKRTFESIVAENSADGATTAMYDASSGSKKCDVFVTAVNIADANGEPIILRSYDEDQSFTIAECAQATTAAPTFFASKTLSDGVIAVDGGLRYNNPAELLIKEARRQYGKGVKFGVFLSIGTGEKETVKLKASKSALSLLSLPGVLAHLVTDSEAIHQRMHARFEETDIGTYFRINVPCIGDFELDNYKAIPDIIAATEEFMNTPEMLQVRKEIVDILVDNMNQTS